MSKKYRWSHWKTVDGVTIAYVELLDSTGARIGLYSAPVANGRGPTDEEKRAMLKEAKWE